MQCIQQAELQGKQDFQLSRHMRAHQHCITKGCWYLPLCCMHWLPLSSWHRLLAMCHALTQDGCNAVQQALEGRCTWCLKPLADSAMLSKTSWAPELPVCSHVHQVCCWLFAEYRQLLSYF
jgi:hypothetical protein